MFDLRGLVLRIRRVGSIDEAYAILEQEVEQRQCDLAAKVEALCDRADGSASDDPDVRDEIGEAWIKVRDLRALLADAVAGNGAEEPGGGAACGLAFGDGYTCDLPKGHE